MAGTNRFQHRDDLVPGVVASAVAYESTGLEPGSHRGLPSPWITLIVSVGNPIRVSGTVADRGGFDAAHATAYDVSVAGLHPVAAMVEQPSGQAGVQLAVHPLAAPAVLGCHASELLGTGDHGHEVLGRSAVELHERVGCAEGPDARLDVVQRWVRERVDRARPAVVRPEVARAWQLVARTGGRCRVEDLTRDVALSARQLRVLVQRELGLSPKQLCCSFRFDAVVAALADGTSGLGEIAASTGYADQSHLTHEFRRMVGVPPTQWLAEERRNLQDGGHRNRPG